MLTQREIPEEIIQLEVLEDITDVYGQLASIWMLRTRDSVLKSRYFLAHIHDVFLHTFAAYTKEIQRVAHRKQLLKDGKVTLLAHNGKKVAVFLSANTGFYGDIIKKTFEMFIDDVRKQDLEATIVGKQGITLFLNAEPNRPHTFFPFADERINPQQLGDLISHLVQYEEIRIYYGKFINFLTQEPAVFVLTANPYEGLPEEEKDRQYMFEPNLETILMFFEKQIFSSMFEQTVQESQLAKFASRISVMDRAGENIRQRLKAVSERRLKLIHQKNNQKQTNTFASIALWSQHA
jgi:F0F1-type ATP synthase gamma subunit